ncbi:hypothetical protein [Nonomuraea sp. JJY05]|uniref:hypothetical protein n=1 Tax=Nonomuraea sp. JJY05 TaxID=3350255 RepID=UPI00373F91B3
MNTMGDIPFTLTAFEKLPEIMASAAFPDLSPACRRSTEPRQAPESVNGDTSRNDPIPEVIVKALLEQLSDRLLQKVVPQATASAIDRCNCECIPCCIWIGNRNYRGKLCYDCISGHRCGCASFGTDCP